MSLPETVVHVPSLNHAPAPVARLTSPRKGPDPECQIVFLSISTHTHNPASQGRQPTPGEWLNTKGAGVSRSRKRHASVYSTPEQGGHEPGANSRALDQKPVFLGFSQLENDYNAHKKCTRTDQKRPNFCFRYFPQISTLMEIPQGNPWKIAENRTLKWGSSPPEHLSGCC